MPVSWSSPEDRGFASCAASHEYYNTHSERTREGGGSDVSMHELDWHGYQRPKHAWTAGLTTRSSGGHTDSVSMASRSR